MGLAAHQDFASRLVNVAQPKGGDLGEDLCRSRWRRVNGQVAVATDTS